MDIMKVNKRSNHRNPAEKRYYMRGMIIGCLGLISIPILDHRRPEVDVMLILNYIAIIRPTFFPVPHQKPLP